MERNEFLELDGLAAETETHEWFWDKSSTLLAHKKSITSNGREDDSLDVKCMVCRNKETGEYDRVVLNNKNEPIYDTKSLESLGFWIDKHKVIKRYQDHDKISK